MLVRRAKITAVLLAVVLVLGIGLVAALPHGLASDALRGALQERVEAVLGVPVVWQDLEVSLTPPGLALVDVEFARAGAAAEEVGMSAGVIRFRLAPSALLRGRGEVEAVVFEGAEVRLTRTTAGLLLPAPIAVWLAERVPSRSAGSARAPEPVPARAGPVRSFVFAQGRVRLVDRTGTSPLHWDAEVLRLGVEMGERTSIEGRGSLARAGRLVDGFDLAVQGRVGEAIDFDLSLREGGRVRGLLVSSGEAGPVLELELEDFDLALIRSLGTRLDWTVAGRATGRVNTAGPVFSPHRVELAVAVSAGSFDSTDYVAEGSLSIAGAVARGARGPIGRVAVDLTQARLRDVHGFEKRAGLGAELTLLWEAERGGEGVEFVQRLSLRDLEATLGPGPTPGP